MTEERFRSCRQDAAEIYFGIAGPGGASRDEALRQAEESTGHHLDKKLETP